MAYALMTKGTVLARLGHYEQAIDACAEATGIYRRLVADEPVYAEDLAAACGNTGPWLHSLGRYVQALSLSREASAIYERLHAEGL